MKINIDLVYEVNFQMRKNNYIDIKDMKIFQLKRLISLLVTFNIISNSIFCIAAEKNSEGDSFSLTRPGAILINREVKAMTDCYVEYIRKWSDIKINKSESKYVHVDIWFSEDSINNYVIKISGLVLATLSFDQQYVNYYLSNIRHPYISIIDNAKIGLGVIYMPLKKNITAFPLSDFGIINWTTAQIYMTYINQELEEVEVYCADQLSDIFMGESVLSQYLLPHTKLIVHYYKSVIPY